MCNSSGPSNITDLVASIKSFGVPKNETALLVKSTSSSLYITISGKNKPGIRRFGAKYMMPDDSTNEQYYVTLLFNERSDTTQDRIYAFYNAKNTTSDIRDSMWMPKIGQICTSDNGGPKNALQNKWTSRLDTVLFCGTSHTGMAFSRLLDVAVAPMPTWQDTRVYGLFRNEWGMTDVCVYTLGDIDKAFNASARYTCVADSKKTKVTAATIAQEPSLPWIMPMKGSGPLLTNFHRYTGITINQYHNGSDIGHNYTVFYLSRTNGVAEKVLHNIVNDTFNMAEYRLTKSRATIVSSVFDPRSKTMYATNRRDFVSMTTVVSCDRYQTCYECFLTRDPYCTWRNDTCQALGPLERPDYSIVAGNYSDTCNATATTTIIPVNVTTSSRYYMSCATVSRHAQYQWRTTSKHLTCDPKKQECVYLIPSMATSDQGLYNCTMHERTLQTDVVMYNLTMT